MLQICQYLVDGWYKPLFFLYQLQACMTVAAALAYKPVVGSSMKIMEGLATSSTAIVSCLRCSVDRPVTPGTLTKDFFYSTKLNGLQDFIHNFLQDMIRQLP